MPSIARNGLVIDYSDDGTGPTVVLLHSSVSGNRQWRRLIAELAPHYRCIAPNLLGYGQTSSWAGDRMQTLDDAAAVALAACELTDGPIRLVGHSWGGAVALATAHKLGPRVTHIALYEPMLIGLLAGHHRAEASQEAQDLYASVRRYGDAGDWLALAKIFTDYFNGDGSWDASPPERRQAVASQLPPNRHEWDAGAPAITAGRFNGIVARGMVLRGTETRLVLRETSNVLAQAFPRWELHDIDGAGHMGPLTHSAVVNEQVKEFLAK
ncbi:MAG: alpha/beta hydrolase [Frateuria sp.]|nr:alpha/beta hydrolase [Frateuria sp.]